MVYEIVDEIVFIRFGKRDGIFFGGVFFVVVYCVVCVFWFGDDLYVMCFWVESEGCDEFIKIIGLLVIRLFYDCIRG